MTKSGLMAKAVVMAICSQPALAQIMPAGAMTEGIKPPTSGPLTGTPPLQSGMSPNLGTSSGAGFSQIGGLTTAATPNANALLVERLQQTIKDQQKLIDALKVEISRLKARSGSPQ